MKAELTQNDNKKKKKSNGIVLNCTSRICRQNNTDILVRPCFFSFCIVIFAWNCMDLRSFSIAVPIDAWNQSKQPHSVIGKCVCFIMAMHNNTIEYKTIDCFSSTILSSMTCYVGRLYCRRIYTQLNQMSNGRSIQLKRNNSPRSPVTTDIVCFRTNVLFASSSFPIFRSYIRTRFYEFGTHSCLFCILKNLNLKF